MNFWVYRRCRKRKVTGLSHGLYDAPNGILIQVHRGFKGLKQAIKLEFKLKRYDKVGRQH